MLSHHEALTRIKAAKLVAILRHVPTEKLDGVVEALMAGGVRVLEFTFDHDRADCVKENAEKIRHTVEKYGDRVLVGCGTALTVQEVEASVEAGGQIVISPNVDVSVIAKTKALGAISMPGALTPTEIVMAHNAGADIVKLFPAGTLGVPYIKAVRGPLGYIPMSAVGGVRPETIADFLNVGVCGFGVGGELVKKEFVRSGDMNALTSRARKFVHAIEQWEANRS